MCSALSAAYNVVCLPLGVYTTDVSNTPDVSGVYIAYCTSVFIVVRRMKGNSL